jgi:hypothetical protein
VEVIVELSKYPVSLIIIGVGDDDDFRNMEYLDSDKNLLRDQNGRTAARDIVQFVKFRDFVNDQGANIIGLSAEVLKELPEQVIDYMIMNKIPLNLEQHIQVPMAQMGQSVPD